MKRKENLSLDNFLVPGLANYVVQFGQKKEIGKGLSTQEIVEVNSLPYKNQQAIIIDEDVDCTVKEVECDRRFIFTSSGTEVTINKSRFSGIELFFYGDYGEDGALCKVTVDTETGTQTFNVKHNDELKLIADKNGYFKIKKREDYQSAIKLFWQGEITYSTGTSVEFSVDKEIMKYRFLFIKTKSGVNEYINLCIPRFNASNVSESDKIQSYADDMSYVRYLCFTEKENEVVIKASGFKNNTSFITEIYGIE